MKDLLVLVADKNMDFLMRGLLPRIPYIENIHSFSFDIFVHPERDPGVYNHSDDFLRPFLNSHRFVMAILDKVGSGQEEYSREEIEDRLGFILSRNGWNDRATPIVIDPELENWIWVNQEILQEVITWNNQLELFDWLNKKNFKGKNKLKPNNPKEAFEEALRMCGTPRSSSLYQEISIRASYRNCKDPAFRKLISQLKEWFRLNE